MAPVGIEPRRRRQGVEDLDVGKLLVLADQHHTPQDGIVFNRVGPEDLHRAGRWQLLGIEDAEQGGLARAVATQQPRDGGAFDLDGHVVERQVVPVAAGQAGHGDRRCHGFLSPLPLLLFVLLEAWIRSTSASVPSPSRLASAIIGST